MEVLIVLGISGGILSWGVLVISICQLISDRLSRKEVILSAAERKKIIESSQENRVGKVKEVLEERGIQWKSANWDNLKQKLTILE